MRSFCFPYPVTMELLIYTQISISKTFPQKIDKKKVKSRLIMPYLVLSDRNFKGDDPNPIRSDPYSLQLECHLRPNGRVNSDLRYLVI